jgi:sporulation protein YlmC with PRC-barrel domain
MRTSLLSAACVAALFAGAALAQETTTETAPETEGQTTGAETAQATETTEPVAGTEATEGTATAQAGDDAAAATDAATAEATEATEGAEAAGDAVTVQATEGVEATGDAATAQTETIEVENAAQTSAEQPDAGAAVTTTEQATSELPPLPSDPQEALAQASSQLDQAMEQYQGAAAGTVGDTTTEATGGEAGTTQVVDQQSQQQVNDALDQFDQALTQYGESSQDEQVQEQVTQLQAQTQQARDQLQNDPQGAMDTIDQLTQAALTLPQSEIPAEADLIINTQLVSSDGEQLGEISNVLVTSDGQVEAILVSRGGALGLGGSDVAVPWDQIQIQGDQTVVNMTQDEVEQLPDYVTD